MIVAEKFETMEISLKLAGHWVTIQKPLSIMRNYWKL